MQLLDAINQLKKEKNDSITERGLMEVIKPHRNEEQHIEAFTILLESLNNNDFQIIHESTELKIEINHVVGPRIAYLLCLGDYEESEISLMKNFIELDDNVLDIGAGMRLTSCYAAKLTNNEVIAVEPDARLHPLIIKNAQLNNASIIVIDGCISSNANSSVVDFYINHEEFWFSSLNKGKNKDHKPPKKIKVLQLENLLSKYQPTVLILDIEGAEKYLFNKKYNHMPNKIIIEIHFQILGSQQASEVINDLTNLGYRIHNIAGSSFAFIR
ncbi:FkbM family methyltransferase [Piscirickettsia litoralis]|uniref:Methyltransferase FkbM domain-containing protein n=1 Tax=Piscirickettsia litoralis TaxID=1891921 RepID=A0ABX3A1W7_9GAMM|nr:FkbM family methyltransferase [Piscirickettsia litoralis]ODN42866.1 hypothetical protein BGC07_07940 [Piscirickettsia litoralis]